MNSKDRAELQRKLSMNAVPRPPAGLADRIKADIPKYLQAEPELPRQTRSFGLSMRLAASILLVVATAIVTVHLMTPGSEQQLAATSTAAAPNVAPSAKMAQAATEEVQIDIRQQPNVQLAQHDASEAPLSRIPAAPAAHMPMPREIARMEQETRADAAASANIDSHADQLADNETAGVAVGGVVGGAMSEGSAKRERDAVAKTAETTAQGTPADSGEFLTRPSRATEERVTVTAEAPAVMQPTAVPVAPAPARAPQSIIPSAFGADLALNQKDNVFGISVDPGVFQRIKSTIESGRRPSASAIDVEALVNYFAGAPEKAPRRGIRLEVEASPAAVHTDGEHAVLRFTIDTPMKTLAPNASTPPVAKNVRVTVDVNRDVVASLQRIGGSDAIAPESVLHYNLSVTGLFDLELKEGLRSTARVVTVRLEYTSVDDGKTHAIERVIHGDDLAKSWTRASRRHRLASLGALWGESLRGSASGVDVARRAGELANQDPKDSRARELANAASAIPAER